MHSSTQGDIPASIATGLDVTSNLVANPGFTCTGTALAVCDETGAEAATTGGYTCAGELVPQAAADTDACAHSQSSLTKSTPSLPRSLAPSLPRSLAPSLHRSVSRSLAPSLPLSLSPSLAALQKSILRNTCPVRMPCAAGNLVPTLNDICIGIQDVRMGNDHVQNICLSSQVSARLQNA